MMSASKPGANGSDDRVHIQGSRRKRCCRHDRVHWLLAALLNASDHLIGVAAVCPCVGIRSHNELQARHADCFLDHRVIQEDGFLHTCEVTGRYVAPQDSSATVRSSSTVLNTGTSVRSVASLRNRSASSQQANRVLASRGILRIGNVQVLQSLGMSSR